MHRIWVAAEGIPLLSFFHSLHVTTELKSHHSFPLPLSLLSMHLSLLFFCFFQIAVGSTVRPATAGAPEKGFSFVTARGCNTTCYPIHRSTSGSFLIVNGFSLFLRRSGSASVNLSLSVTGVPRCGVSALPNRRIDLTGSPFRVSNETCRDIAVLRPCVPDFRKCKLNEWEIEILSEPVLLFPGCEHRYSGTARCSSSIPPELDRFLGSEIRVEWEEREYEPYLTRCKSCGVEKKLRRFNASESQFLCFESRKGNEIKADESKPSNKTAILTSLCAFMSLLLLAAAAVAIFRCKGLNLRSNAAEEDPTALFLHRHRSSNLLPPVFSYEELEYSTNGFDPKRKIGDGGFGSVYLAQLADGRIVAVKKLHRRHATKSFSNEVIILSSIDHANLVKLHGYCCDRRGLLLVYDYVPNGTLADHLHGSKSQYRRISLTWPVRLDVAVQTAMAIEYLHFSLDPAVVHRDITSSNIFVEKDMRVRVGDFGLSRLLVYTESSPNCVWTGPQGTPGYLDPDYHRSYQLTEKSDIYSFGVVLLELLSGLKAVDLSREKRDVALADLVVAKIQSGAVREVVDPVLAVEGEGLMGSVHAVAELAFRCVAAVKDDRPDAREVAAELKRIRMRIRDAIVGGVAGMG